MSNFFFCPKVFKNGLLQLRKMRLQMGKGFINAREHTIGLFADCHPVDPKLDIKPFPKIETDDFVSMHANI